jgi:tetratricopeptide (TPR) repeat protein
MAAPDKTVEIPKELVGRFAAGQLTIAQLVRLTPEAQRQVALVGYNYLQSGNAHKALDIYQGLVAASPRNAVFHTHLGATLIALEEYERAFQHYDEAVRLDPANVDALAGRGELNLRRQKMKEAILDLAECVRLDAGKRVASAVRAAQTLLMLKERVTAVRKSGEKKPPEKKPPEKKKKKK